MSVTSDFRWQHSKHHQMARGKLPTDYKKGQILAMSQESVPIRKIVFQFRRSKKAMEHFLKRPNTSWQGRNLKNTRKISTRQEAALVREACKRQNTESELRCSLALPTVNREVQHIISIILYLRQLMILQTTYITPKNKQEKLAFARSYVSSGLLFAEDYVLRWKPILFGRSGRLEFQLAWSQEVTKKVLKKAEWWRLHIGQGFDQLLRWRTTGALPRQRKLGEVLWTPWNPPDSLGSEDFFRTSAVAVSSIQCTLPRTTWQGAFCFWNCHVVRDSIALF